MTENGYSKQFLRKIGLFTFAKKAYRNIKLLKYQRVNKWHLHIENLSLTYDTKDLYSKLWFFPRYDKGHIHEPVATKLFLKIIKEDSLVFDIGGHLGYFTCIAGKLASNGSVNVFEVDPKCIELINKNININKLTNISVNNIAVSDKNEMIRIPQYDSPNSGLAINFNLKESYLEVESVRLDDFVSKTKIKPDFIKIDVEGAELLVLEGMKNLLKQDNLILLLEIHVDKLKNHFNSNYQDCIDILLKNGFILENIDHRLTESSFENVDRNTILNGNTMLLCKKCT